MLRAARSARGMTLADLSRETGISVSTLSRLETGKRKATLDLLAPIARCLEISLDELAGRRREVDPRVRRRPTVRDGITTLPLSGPESVLQAFHQTIPAGDDRRPVLQTHDGYEWLYVLRGRVRLLLGKTEVFLGPGEAAEFDTSTPHWFGNGGRGLAQYLTIFGPEGEKIHLRARPHH
jgi:transcriptional regulator with XRE-family HTH domain